MALQHAELGARIAELREARGNPPQNVVAQQMGVGYRSYQAWESGETRPEWRNLERLADYYGVDQHWLLTGQGPSEPRPQRDQLDRIEAMLTAVMTALKIPLPETADPGDALERELEDAVQQGERRADDNEADEPGLSQGG